MMKKNTEAGDDMTQKERILNAKHCLDALALGLDPATGAELPDDSVLNRVELSRCFFFVSGLLQELHERGGQGLGLPFALPAEQRAQFPFSERPMLISEICRILNEMADPFVYRKLRTTTITNWLLHAGLLEVSAREGGDANAPPDGAGAHHWPVGRGAQRKARHLHRYAVRAGGAALHSGQSRRNAVLRVAAAGLTSKQILPKISIFLAFDWPAPLICGNIMTILTGNGESLCQNHRIRN